MAFNASYKGKHSFARCGTPSLDSVVVDLRISIIHDPVIRCTKVLQKSFIVFVFRKFILILCKFITFYKGFAKYLTVYGLSFFIKNTSEFFTV